MKLHCRWLLLFLLFVCFQTHAQVAIKIDSLKKVIAATTVDSLRVNALIELCDKYRDTLPDEALKVAFEARDLAEKIDFKNGKAWALKRVGQVYNIQSDYVHALQAWKEALAIFESTGEKKGQSNMLNNIGVVFYNKTMEDSAQTYYLRSLKVAEEIKDTLRISTALANVGGVYSNKPKTYDKALEYHQRALRLGLAIHDTDIIGNSNANIGELYLNKSIADTLHRSVNLDSALYYLSAAKQLREGGPDYAYTLNNIGKVYRQQKKYDLAIKNHTEAYESAKNYDAKLDMGQALLSIAQTDTSIGDYRSAIDYYMQTESLMKEIGQEATYDLQYVYEGLFVCYEKLKDYQNAVKYQSMLIDVRKQIYTLDTENKLGSALFEFNIGQVNAEVNLQKEIVNRQKIIRNGFIGGFAVVLLFAGVFFTQRNRISKEKKRSDELLLNILPEETAEELKATGTAKAKSFDMVSVLFTDFKNFTQASELLSPADLVAEINHCYSEFDKIITRHGVEKIKTIGDAYMCAGGLPAHNTTNPYDVVLAGLEMVDFIEKNKQERMAKGQPYFELRCGIHTGPVVAGIVGIKKFAYDIWGDTVNTASRMESSGEIGKVNISGATYELVKDKFICEHRGKVKAKNKGEIDMYFVTRKNPA